MMKALASESVPLPSFWIAFCATYTVKSVNTCIKNKFLRHNLCVVFLYLHITFLSHTAAGDDSTLTPSSALENTSADVAGK